MHTDDKATMPFLYLPELRPLCSADLHAFFTAVPERTACRTLQGAWNLRIQAFYLFFKIHIQRKYRAF